LGTIKSVVISKSGSKKPFESVEQSPSEMPYGTTSPLSIKDIDNKIGVWLQRQGSDSSIRTRASKVSKQIKLGLEKVLIETIRSLPLEPKNTCPYASAIRNSRFE
jgi:hypothetical protein